MTATPMTPEQFDAQRKAWCDGFIDGLICAAYLFSSRPPKPGDRYEQLRDEYLAERRALKGE